MSPLSQTKRRLAGRKATRATPRPRNGRSSAAQSHGHSILPRSSQSRDSTANVSPPAISHATEATAESRQENTLSEGGGDDDLCQIIMAIDMKDRGTVGCSYYVADQKKLYIVEDIASGGMDVVETYSQFRLPYHLEVRPIQEFGFERAKTKLTSLKLRQGSADIPKFLVPGNAFSHENAEDAEDVGFTSQQGELLYLAGIVDMENHVSVGCAGALIAYLQRKRSTQDFQGDSAGDQLLRIDKIEMSSLKSNMFINRDTLSSLQIIQSESHPNAFNQGPGQTSSSSKESLSIYGLFHRFARTSQGKTMLRQIFLRPTIHQSIISERHVFISTFLRVENADAVAKLTKSLKGIKNLRPVMIHLQKGISTGNARFRGFKSVVWATILEAMHKLELAKLHQVGRVIHETVDLESSVQERRTIVRPGVDQELDKMKEMYNGMESLLSDVAVTIAATLPEELSNELNVIYFPQLGFNIAIPLDEQGRPVYDGGDEEWAQVFTTENRAYFKDFRMHEMDERLGDMYGNICAKEIEIVYDLAQSILGYEEILVEASDVCGEIDSLLALAHGADLYKLVRPQMTDENVVIIKGGRHILHEATVSSYVPNDTFLVGGKGTERYQSPTDDPKYSGDSQASDCTGPSMLLLTGPNYSGKSVYLKQVALIIYMAHIGSFVPAKTATIGVTDKILTRITSRETVSKTQSTFAIDLQQISFAVANSTNRSLIIIDEFGKGTESAGDERPKVIGATHFHEILENEFLPQRPELQLGHMEVQVDPAASELQDQITYLYNFRFGRSSESFGTICAAMNGIDLAIVSRANEIGDLSRREEDLVAACAKMTNAEINELEVAENIARNFLQANFSRPLSNIRQCSQSDTVTSILDGIVGNISDADTTRGGGETFQAGSSSDTSVEEVY
ncbi:MutS domain III family protein [Coccidioides posadasii C735 delta SOWgp]|uniref:DNA mismatch repair protein MSH5 n=1 Tax=Coccidioides posadasii (strain C735) TaxID=222929 RepID=C5P5L3_COCP7|nr:MutS domain III family protein [Coccidioides posadasii C735 delta SOWgp]EER28003.1 MutS domain III family protein [Coccidioides posadasii C735 delta SOWgp]|eukprot:XP_003070148.1 MutS domain III family protein [Coccidioides posadasii C735 delta SOWgp]